MTTEPKKPRTIEVPALEFPTAHEAIQQVDTDREGKAIRLGGQTLVVAEADARRLADAGVEFAYLFDLHGRIVAVPVND